MRLAALTLFLALVAGCDSADTRSIGGAYVFTEAADVSNGGRTTTATLVIPETASGGTFSFSYTFDQTDGATGAVIESTVGAGSGTYDHPGVTFRITSETASGTVSDDGGRIVIEETGFVYQRLD